MAKAQLLAKTLESVGEITGAVIGQDLFHPDAPLLEPEDGSAEKSHGRVFTLVREDFDGDRPRRIHLADPVIFRSGDEEVARPVHRHARGGT